MPILEEYRGRVPECERFCAELVSLLPKVLADYGSQIHEIRGRVKTIHSLQNKIRRSPGRYNSLANVTDIVGVRIITYFADDVDVIADRVQSEFEVDWHNSVDKRKALEPDRFGYLSLHYVVSMPEKRIALPENRRFRGMKAEIQVRSVLQHSWAEIYHDLGYKAKTQVPLPVQRQFFQVAGLLELADAEFVRIRDHLATYRRVLPEKIAHQPQDVRLDAESLERFVVGSKLVASIDSSMAKACGDVRVTPHPHWLDGHVDQFASFGVTSIADLEGALETWRTGLEEYARRRLSRMNYAHVLRGVSVNYLPYFLAARNGQTQEVLDFFDRFGLFSPTTGERRLVSRIVLEIINGMTNEIAGSSEPPQRS